MPFLATAAIAACSVLLSACGGAGAASTGDAAGAGPFSPAVSSRPTRHLAKETTSDNHGGGAAAFIRPGGDNSIQEFGSEAGAAERHAAARVLEAYLAARAAGSWGHACRLLAGSAIAPMLTMTGGKRSGCASTLAALSAGVPARERVDLAAAGVAALRVAGARAFALFHGPHRVDWFMPMAHRGGAWRVAAIAPSELP